MYTDVAVFGGTDTVEETVAAIRLLCLPRGRARIFVPEGARDLERERALLARTAGAGVHISLDSVDPRSVGERVVTDVAPGCESMVVVRPSGASLALGVLERLLMKHTHVPVWFWNTPRVSALTIVAAGDPDPNDPRRDGVNADTVDLATDLALRSVGSVVLVNAWQLDGEYDMRHSPFLRIGTAETVAARHALRAARASWLDALADRCRRRGVAVEIELREGPRETVIPAVVEERNASVLVVGTMKRRGFAAMARPNTATTLAEGFSGSLTVVPPGSAEAGSGRRRFSRIAAGAALA